MVCVCVCVRACVRARACVCVCVCVHACVCVTQGTYITNQYWNLSSYHHLIFGTSPSCGERNRRGERLKRENNNDTCMTYNTYKATCIRHTAHGHRTAARIQTGGGG